MANSTFEILSVTMRQEYKVTQNTVITTGNIDYQQNVVTAITGTLYEKTESGATGNYIGTFNGRMVDGSMKYSFSEMSHEQAELAWAAIEVIEDSIFDQNAE